MNNIFKEYIDQFVLVFLDDIFIYSKTKAKHEENIKKLLQVL